MPEPKRGLHRATTTSHGAPPRRCSLLQRRHPPRLPPGDQSCSPRFRRA
ncbi:hypothetical protein ACFPRL_20265 [Pseudoclavibacter helvolus]